MHKKLILERCRFSVAPMMDLTNRHCRYFHRQLSRHALLYSEMLTTGAVIHGDRDRLLGFDPAEHPLALQLGGCDPIALARCAQIGADWDYDEINLNVGCPSDRVQAGRFGACLMAEPALVADCVAAMRAALGPRATVTVKTRIGIDQQDSYEALAGFVEQLIQADCQALIVHARKAWLKGLSPKQNREVPPLRYDVVYRLKKDFPQLPLAINGGVVDLDQALTHLQQVDGVMLGRAAYQNPYLLADVDRRLFGNDRLAPSRHQVIERLLPYIDRWLSAGGRLTDISRHLLGLFQGRPGAKAWRRQISEHAYRRGAGAEVIRRALRHVPDEEPDPAACSPARLTVVG